MNNVLDALIEALEKESNVYIVIEDVANKFLDKSGGFPGYAAEFTELLELAKNNLTKDYTPCPVDSKGEAIHVGDMLIGIGEVYGVSETMVFAGDLKIDIDDAQPLIKTYIASGQIKCNDPLVHVLMKLVRDARGYESRDDAALVAKHIEAIQEAMVGEASNVVG